MIKRIAAVVIVALFVVTAAFALSACKGGDDSNSTAVIGPTGPTEPTAPDAVKEFTYSKQSSGNVSVTNYQTILNADVNWNGMSMDEKQELIDYTFTMARQKADKDGVGYYNIMCKGEPTKDQAGQMYFLYSQDDNEVILYTDGAPTDRIPAPPAS